MDAVETPEQSLRFLKRFIRDMDDVRAELLTLVESIESATGEEKQSVVKQAQAQLLAGIYLLQKQGR